MTSTESDNINKIEPLRVLHVFGGLDAGGAESRTMDIYRHIDRSKVQFDFLIRKQEKQYFEDEIKKLGGNIYRLPTLSISNIKLFIKSIKEFFKMHNNYKILHGHTLSTAFIYLHYAKKYGIPVRIAHSRCGKQENNSLKGFIGNILIKLSKFDSTDMFAVSKIAAYAPFGKNAVKKGKVKIWPNAIDAKKYTFNSDVRKKVRRDLGINENQLVIIHIGRFSKQKNHKYLISIFKNIYNKNNNSILLLVGKGELEDNIKNIVNKEGLEDNVKFLGVRDDVPELLQAADVLCFPSFFEGLPGVVLEAQASGLPCIVSDKVTDEVAITDLVKFISLSKKEEYWSDCIIQAASTNRRDTYDKIASAGFDIHTVTKKYEKFYLERYQ